MVVLMLLDLESSICVCIAFFKESISDTSLDSSLSILFLFESWVVFISDFISDADFFMSELTAGATFCTSKIISDDRFRMSVRISDVRFFISSNRYEIFGNNSSTFSPILVSMLEIILAKASFSELRF